MKLKQFQRNDIARIALVDGGILSWDTGLGKSLAAYLWPMLKLGCDIKDKTVSIRGTVLFVVPGDLHEQFALHPSESTAKMFRQKVTHIDSITTYRRLAPYQSDGSKGVLPNGFYITSYSELTTNGREKHNGLTLADVSKDAFDCIVVDEGVRLKSIKSLVSVGVRKMRAKYRLVLTATPIKNRLVDIFPLAAWSCHADETANERWPYSPREIEKFKRDYMVIEENHTQRFEHLRKTGQRKTFKKVTHNISNVSGLWRAFAPVVLRRRKDDCGEDIAKKVNQVVRVPLGLNQSKVYEYHLNPDRGNTEARYTLQALRVAASDPTSQLLLARNTDDPTHSYRSEHKYTPKIAAIMQLIDEIIARKEQVVVFSSLMDVLKIVAGYLEEAQIPYGTLTGSVSQKKRGQSSVEFGLGKFPVMLAGEESASEGHNWWRCNNVIRCSYSWAYDKCEQCVNRAHRLLSPKPVNIYSVMCDGSIDERLLQTEIEKRHASELALDGKLITKNPEEINYWQEIQAAIAAYNNIDKATLVDEVVLGSQWPALRRKLWEHSMLWKHYLTPEPLGLTHSHTDRQVCSQKVSASSRNTLSTSAPRPSELLSQHQSPVAPECGQENRKADQEKCHGISRIQPPSSALSALSKLDQLLAKRTISTPANQQQHRMTCQSTQTMSASFLVPA